MLCYMPPMDASLALGVGKGSCHDEVACLDRNASIGTPTGHPTQTVCDPLCGSISPTMKRVEPICCWMGPLPSSEAADACVSRASSFFSASSLSVLSSEHDMLSSSSTPFSDDPWLKASSEPASCCLAKSLLPSTWDSAGAMNDVCVRSSAEPSSEHMMEHSSVLSGFGVGASDGGPRLAGSGDGFLVLTFFTFADDGMCDAAGQMSPEATGSSYKWHPYIAGRLHAFRSSGALQRHTNVHWLLVAACQGPWCLITAWTQRSSPSYRHHVPVEIRQVHLHAM